MMGYCKSELCEGHHIPGPPFPHRELGGGRDASTAQEDRFALLLLRSA